MPNHQLVYTVWISEILADTVSSCQVAEPVPAFVWKKNSHRSRCRGKNARKCVPISITGSHKSNLQDQGSFIEMVIFRCCGLKQLPQTIHDFMLTVASSYFRMTKINSKSAGWNEMWGQVLIHGQLSSFEICCQRIRASGESGIDEIMILIPG